MALKKKECPECKSRNVDHPSKDMHICKDCGTIWDVLDGITHSGLNAQGKMSQEDIDAINEEIEAKVQAKLRAEGMWRETAR